VHQGAVDLRQHEREVDVEPLADADAQAAGDGAEVAAERALAVGLDEPDVGGDVGVGAGVVVVAVDVERGRGAPGDVLEDPRLAAERGVDRRRRDVGRLGDRRDRGGDVAAFGEQPAGRGGDLFPRGQRLPLAVARPG
jgi:hypothetical protein